jgi:ABC-2 type transport system permease protein
MVYIPSSVIHNFSILKSLLVLGVAVIWVVLAYRLFYKGLKKYESGNLIINKL